MDEIPKRVRVDLFKGPPPYDNLSKDKRVAFWLLRPDKERIKKQAWILTFFERGRPKSIVYRGFGWENAAQTFFGECYEHAQQNWEKYHELISDIAKLPPGKMIKQPGFRPTSVKKLRAQLNGEWGAFKASFLRRLHNDRQTLQEGMWPLPEIWPLPWENP